MSSAKIYALVADLLSLAGRHSEDTIASACSHIEKTMVGAEGEAVGAALRSLLQLKRVEATPRIHRAAPASTSDEDLSNNKAVVPIVREVRAMLSDPAFLPTKSDILDLARRYENRLGPVELSSRDSRSRTIGRLIGAFSAASLEDQAIVYKQLRRAYMHARSSTVRDWRRIIADDAGK